MKLGHLTRTVLTQLFSLSGISCIYRQWHKKKHGPLVKALVFHDLESREWFEAVISSLKETYNIISPEDFEARRFSSSQINILITFDDAYESWVTHGEPVLAQHGVRALFFVNSGLIEVSHDAERRVAYERRNLLQKGGRSIMGEDGLVRLQKGGHTIGGHTATHARLASLSREDEERTVQSDKVALEKILGETITHFAYPFGSEGDYTEMTKEILAWASYTYAWTTAGTFISFCDPYALPRMSVIDGQSIASLRTWIEGGYDVYRILKSLCVR